MAKNILTEDDTLIHQELENRLKSDSHVSEIFFKLKFSPTSFEKIPLFVCLVFKIKNNFKIENFVFLKNRLI